MIHIVVAINLKLFDFHLKEEKASELFILLWPLTLCSSISI